MRIVVLSSSLYSETACAMAVRMANLGHILTGALSLTTLSRGTLLRKFGQWGVQGVTRYARAKLLPQKGDGDACVDNPYLASWLKQKRGTFRSLREVATFYGFPVAVCDEQNSSESIAHLEAWAPDLIIFTGGNILQKPLLQVPRLGVLNVHLALLPEIRGMSSPEWSLLNRVPVGITIHYMDTGIDTGPILQRHEFPNVAECEALSDLRNRLIAFGVEKVGQVVEELARGAMSLTPQSDIERDTQFFVMHEWLQEGAEGRLKSSRRATIAGAMHG